MRTGIASRTRFFTAAAGEHLPVPVRRIGGMVMGRDSVEGLLIDPPYLHEWEGAVHVGGLEGLVGRRFADAIADRFDDEPFDALETGAGLSTLLLLAMGARSVTSVTPDPELATRVVSEVETRGLDRSRLDIVVERSEVALPKLSEAGREFDVALLDGGHGWPTVFVDFCYANACMGRGSLFLLDDCQLHSVRQLLLLLSLQPGFEVLSREHEWKLGVVRKDTDEHFLPDHAGQPFIVSSSPKRPG